MSMPSLPSDLDQPPRPYFRHRVAYERRLLAPDAGWVPLFRVEDHPAGYGVNLCPAARSLVLGRHPGQDAGVVHLRLELHQDEPAARAAARVARAHFREMGYPDTRVRVQGVEVGEAPYAGADPILAAFATLVVVRHAREQLPPGAALPWVTRRDRREGTRHAEVGLAHELYLLLAEVSDCLSPHDDGQVQRWRFGPGVPTAISRGPVTVSCLCPGRLRLWAEDLRLESAWQRTRFAEFLAALRCHPAVWAVGASVHPGAAGHETAALAAAGFECLDPAGDDEDGSGGEPRDWSLDLPRDERGVVRGRQ